MYLPVSSLVAVVKISFEIETVGENEIWLSVVCDLSIVDNLKLSDDTCSIASNVIDWIVDVNSLIFSSEDNDATDVSMVVVCAEVVLDIWSVVNKIEFSDIVDVKSIFCFKVDVIKSFCVSVETLFVRLGDEVNVVSVLSSALVVSTNESLGNDCVEDMRSFGINVWVFEELKSI